MNETVSFDFQISFQREGRGAKKQLSEGIPDPPPSKQPIGRVPRVSRYMALAIYFEDLLRQGIVTDYAELARLGHVTRARVTQIMNLRLLAPEIQEELLFLEPLLEGNSSIQLKMLQSIASDLDWREQRKHWKSMTS